MICIQIQWWTWNQLFQYAFGQVLGKFYNTEVVYDIWTYHPLSSFNIMARLGFFTPRQFELWKLVENIKIESLSDKIKFKNTEFHKIFYHFTKKSPKNHKLENAGYIYDKSWFELDDPVKNNYYCSGTWNVAKYFEWSERINIKLSSESSKLIELSDLVNSQNNNWIETVGIHIRRWDYTKLWLVICDAEYYRKWIETIQKSSWNKDLHIYVFSDDHNETLRDLPFLADYQHTFINFDDYEKANNCQIKWFDDVEKLILMSRCKNHIIANSTYSRRWAFLSTLWWITIAPKSWMKNISSDPVVPENWVKI